MNLEFDFCLIGFLGLAGLFGIAGLAVLQTDYAILCVPLFVCSFVVILLTITYEVYIETEDDDEFDELLAAAKDEDEASQESGDSIATESSSSLRQRTRSKTL